LGVLLWGLLVITRKTCCTISHFIFQQDLVSLSKGSQRGKEQQAQARDPSPLTEELKL